MVRVKLLPDPSRYAHKQLTTPAHRYMPYWVVCGSLALAFLVLILWLVAQRKLLPGIVILGSFILFVLWLTGLIKSSIVLWGPQGSVNDNCMQYVTNMPVHGQSLNTLAWLEQNSICITPPNGLMVTWSDLLMPVEL